MNAIETVGLTKHFTKTQSYRDLLRFGRGDKFVAVDAVDLQIHAGELFGLLGPNGAGKSTLVKMLSTLVTPSQGEARIYGHDVVHAAGRVKGLIGLVDCQERSFFWRLTGRQNLAFFAALYGLPEKLAQRQVDGRIDELLALVGLTTAADQRFAHYSSGMRQMLALARGLLPMPRLLFLDEPTRSLDPVSARHLRGFVRETLVDKLGHTVVLVTHRLEEAEKLCDRVAIMQQGRILACGTVAALKQRLALRSQVHLHVSNLAPTIMADLQQIPGILQATCRQDQMGMLQIELLMQTDHTALAEVIATLVAQGGAIQQCHSEELSLEDAFVQLVTVGQPATVGAPNG